MLERESEVARGASFANGGLLTPSMSMPWNAPGIGMQLLRSLLQPAEAPMRVRLRAAPGYARWGVRFLRSANAASYERNTHSNLALARHSLNALRGLQVQTGIHYSHRAAGSLQVFRSPAAQALAAAAALKLEGLRFRQFESREIAAIEPALEPVAGELAGAIHYEEDETGDARAFCEALAAHLKLQGVEQRLSTPVTQLVVKRGRIVSALAESQAIGADHFVVAGGSESASLLRRVGASIPVQPIKGHSITIDDREGSPKLSIPIVDDHWHIGVVPIGDRLRLVGGADLSGADQALEPERIRHLV